MTKAEKSWIIYDWANSAFVVAIITAILPIYFKDVTEESRYGIFSLIILFVIGFVLLRNVNKI